MKEKYKLKRLTPAIPGVSVVENGVEIHAALYGKKSRGIILYPKNGETEIRIDFPDEIRVGREYHCALTDLNTEEYTYLFHEDGETVIDKCAKAFSGHRLFGEEHRKAGKKDELNHCLFVKTDRPAPKPDHSYEDSLYYGLHVRGFTKDASSGLEGAGTFLGVKKKIPYLKKMGVTGIVLQPCYEFEECMEKKDGSWKMNLWGYGTGYYYAPKNAYSFSENAPKEFSDLVNTLHRQGIEVIMEFSFSADIVGEEQAKILLYWTNTYGVDGFRLIGEADTCELLGNPALADTKLWFEYLPEDYEGRSGEDKSRIAVCGREPMYAIRKFLKGDEDSLSDYLKVQRTVNKGYGTIGFLADHDGFRLKDLVSYNWKHNEDNGEDNRDGSDYNCSWNCGTEGDTKKKSINLLRKKQMWNAMCLLFLSETTPYLYMGDEYGRSSGGNNNPYCHDDERNYMKWVHTRQEKNLFEEVCALSELRRKKAVIHRAEAFLMTDRDGTGYPDFSYHGEEPWNPDFKRESKSIGLLFCEKEGEYLYIFFNMSWKEMKISLPKLPKGREWKRILDTGDCGDIGIVGSRTIQIFEG